MPDLTVDDVVAMQRTAMRDSYEKGWKDGCRDAINECKRLGIITEAGQAHAATLLARLDADGG